MRPVVVATILCVIALGLTGCAETDGSGQVPVAAKAKKSDKPDKPSTSGKQDKVQHRTVEKRSTIPSGTQVRRTSALTKGDRRVLRQGQRGVRVTVWRLTIKNGKVTDRTKVRTRVVRKPVPTMLLVGTTPANKPGCDFNYSGCVPFASDVDCLGGSGNGPEYVAGPVEVLVNDIYDLDSDGDGWGCDS